MRQDKDRSSQWLIAHHGDAILKLAGITGFTSWRSLQSETIAPRRLPDGLLEVHFPQLSEPTLFLIEIESYASTDVDRQVFEDLAIVFLERRIVPEVVSLVLKSKGNASVSGRMTQSSLRGTSRIGGDWPVTRLWELTADRLLADDDVGLVPWVPLTQTDLPPNELLGRCAERIAAVPNELERSGLLAVTQILAGLAYPKLRFDTILGGAKAMIESPVLDEAMELMEKIVTERVEKRVEARIEAQVAAQVTAQIAAQLAAHTRGAINQMLAKRFGSAVVSSLDSIHDQKTLDALLIQAATCSSLENFNRELQQSH